MSDQYGDATVVKDSDGTIRVTHADDVILVAAELLQQAGHHHYQDEVLTLDTAGEYRYRLLRQHDLSTYVFERIKP